MQHYKTIPTKNRHSRLKQAINEILYLLGKDPHAELKIVTTDELERGVYSITLEVNNKRNHGL